MKQRLSLFWRDNWPYAVFGVAVVAGFVTSPLWRAYCPLIGGR